MNKKYIISNEVKIISGLIDLVIGVFLLPNFLELIFSRNDISLASILGYFIFFPIFFKGQTFGQLIFGLKIYSLVSKKLTFSQLVFRPIYAFFLNGLFLFAEIIGMFSYKNDLKQLPADLIFKCVFIKVKYSNSLYRDLSFTDKPIHKINIFIGILMYLYLLSPFYLNFFITF